MRSTPHGPSLCDHPLPSLRKPRGLHRHEVQRRGRGVPLRMLPLRYLRGALLRRVLSRARERRMTDPGAPPQHPRGARGHHPGPPTDGGRDRDAFDGMRWRTRNGIKEDPAEGASRALAFRTADLCPRTDDPRERSTASGSRSTGSSGDSPRNGASNRVSRSLRRNHAIGGGTRYPVARNEVIPTPFFRRRDPLG